MGMESESYICIPETDKLTREVVKEEKEREKGRH